MKLCFFLNFIQTPNDDVKLLTLLNVTSLLATCAEGRGKFAEIVCHKIFTVKELLRLVYTYFTCVSNSAANIRVCILEIQLLLFIDIVFDF